MNLHRRPLFPIAVAYIAGIVCAAEMRLSPATGLWVGSIVILAAAVLPIRTTPRSVMVLAGVVFLVGLIRTSAGWVVPPDDISRYAEGKLVHLTGAIASDPEPRDDGSVRFELRAESVKTYTGEYPVSGRAMVTVYRPSWQPFNTSDYVPFYGDRLRIHGRLKTPAPPANPDSGSYADYLARRRIYCSMVTPVGVTERLGAGSGLGRATAWFKAVLTAKVHDLLPDDRGNLLLGILLGNYGALPLNVQSAFMRTGTMHLLAASGYNCGVIVLILRWILRRLTVPRAWMHVLLIALLWGFAMLAGAGPSIIRATIMMTVFLSAYLLWRAADMLNSVMLSGLIILMASPLSLYDVGFQLSFAAVLAIILVMPLLEAFLRSRREKDGKKPARRYGLFWRSAEWSWRNVVAAVLLSIAATLGTLPVTAYYFNYISVVSILANAMVTLLVVALTVFGLVSLIFNWLPLIGAAAVIGAGWIAGWMLSIVTALGGFSWSSYSVRSPSWVFVLFYYAVLLAILEYAHRIMILSHRESKDAGEKTAE